MLDKSKFMDEKPESYKIGDMITVHGEDAPVEIIGIHGGSFAFRDRYGRNLIRSMPFIFGRFVDTKE